MIILYKKINGFTLVELLAVIAVLSIISVVAGGIIVNSLGNAKGDIDKTQETMLINTAKMYYQNNLDYRYGYYDENNKIFVTEELTKYNICIQKNLVEEGYLDEFKDDKSNDIYGYIKVKNNGGKYTYTYMSGGENNCVPCQEKGDVNRDGIVDMTDAYIVQQYVVFGTVEPEYKDSLEKYGDMDGDHEVAGIDAFAIARIFNNDENRACPY